MFARLRRPLILARRRRPTLTATLELRAWPLAALWAAATGLYVLFPSATLAMAWAGLTGLLGWTLAYAWGLAGDLVAERTLRYSAMQVGDELEETITLTNRAPFPCLFAEVIDDSNVPGYALSAVCAVPAYSATTWRARVICTQRGRFRLGPWRLQWGDPFGVWRVCQQYAAPRELVVYPSLAALPAYLLPHTPTLGERQLLRQPLPAATPNAITTRPHTPGDPLRHVHWPTTARRGELHTKVFEPESTRTAWLLPDLDPAAQLGAGNDSTVETAVLLAAALAAQLLQKGLRVGLMAAEGDQIALTPARSGLGHLWAHLHLLAGLQATPEALPLAALLPRARPALSPRDLLVVITPSLDPAWPRALIEAIQRGARAEALVLDPASFGGHALATGFVPGLAALGVPAHIVHRGEVRPVLAAHGALRRWEFLTLGTGRAVVRQTPRGAPSLETQLAALQARAP